LSIPLSDSLSSQLQTRQFIHSFESCRLCSIALPPPLLTSHVPTCSMGLDRIRIPLIRSLSGSGITIPGRSRAKSKSGGSRKSSGGGTPVPGLSTAQPNPESVTNRNPDGVGRNDNANVSVESRASDQDTVLRPSIHISSTADSRPTTAHVNANDAPYSRTVDLSSTPATRTNHTSFNAREDTNTNSDILHPSELRNSTSNSNLNPDRNIHQPATTIEQSHTILPHLRPQHLTVSPSSYSTFLLSNDPPVVIMQRKVWVRRPSASATLVTVQDDDLVDSVRDMIMHKYANSLGRTIDSPDITLKITTREQAGKSISQERVLGPEEIIGRKCGRMVWLCSMVVAGW
jgi:hypothetical protein